MAVFALERTANQKIERFQTVTCQRWKSAARPQKPHLAATNLRCNEPLDSVLLSNLTMISPRSRASFTATLLLLLIAPIRLASAHVDDQRLIYQDNTVFDFTGADNRLNPALLAELREDAAFAFADIRALIGNASYPTIPCPLMAGEQSLSPRDCYQQLVEEYYTTSISYIKSLTTVSNATLRSLDRDQENNANADVKIAVIDSGVDLNRFISTYPQVTNLWADVTNRHVRWNNGDYLRYRDGTPMFGNTREDRLFTIGFGMDYVGFDGGVFGRSLRSASGGWDGSAFQTELMRIPFFVRIGADGRDRWPFPYIIRTDTFNPSLRENRDLIDFSKNNRRRILALRRAFMNDLSMTSASSGLRTRLLDILHPARNLEEEMTNQADHGTHLTGLMRNLSVFRALTPLELSRRQPGDTTTRRTFEAKVVPFRVYQPNRPSISEIRVRRRIRRNVEDENLTLINNIRRAVAESAARGVKIVNLSFTFGYSFEAHTSGALNRDQQSRLALWDRTFRQIVDSHPEMVFVTAAGNEGQRIDGVTAVRPRPNEYIRMFRRIPCDLENSNVLCVGALNRHQDDFWRDDDNSAGSNYLDIARKREFVLAVGEDVRSNALSKYCDSYALESYLNGDPIRLPPLRFDPNFRSANPAWQRENNYSTIKSSCLDRSDQSETTVLSGTSQAAALASRAVANMLLRGDPEMDLMSLSGAEIVRRFLDLSKEQTNEVVIRGVTYKKIRSYPGGY